MKRSLTIVLAVLGIAASAQADSPLTSTQLSAGYESEPLVAQAAQAGMTPAVAAALADPAVPHDLRTAMIAAMGWSLRGQDNARRFLTFVARRRHDTSPARLRVAELGAQEALALGYLVAMDDYLQLEPMGGQGEVERASALTLLAHAQREAPNEPVVALVHGLVRAQHALHEGNWCKAWQAVSRILAQHGQSIPMRRPALDSITSYMSLYRSYC